MDHWRAAVLMAVAVAVMSVATGVAGDIAADRAECSNTLIGLATCLTYVQDEAVAPTPDCCAGLKTLLQTSRKCLCVLVKDRDDPSRASRSTAIELATKLQGRADLRAVWQAVWWVE
ncbi:hypothetical protein GUJ93_ZPchr0007g6120 [Zizania palustris]|uniref:Bifunctional inhibitor/plant lipid transfer protein/seed storage helical domain-containing protein n=1 Tax=Zizania palustris TaxID=103762 RepID=A0A8J5T6A0_ZIZPA|nr:hypothetical protein GUJ93_ZPchr0007g6120 [Zizania palustris]